MTGMPNESIAARFQLTYANRAHRAFTLDVDIKMPGQGVSAIFGHSGSGKTTLLRCLAGLQRVKGGELVVNGDTWQSEKHFRPTHKRRLGYVFQESSLFPHLTAHENLGYALKRAGNPQMHERYQRVVALMGIRPILQRYPSQLSGGERQRVAIARALLIDPHLLLMDEPLASLDASRKQEIMPYLERLREEFKLPIVYISHSIDEVVRLADYLIVLEQGAVAARGTVAEMLSRVDLPVRLGEDVGVLLAAQVVERDPCWHLARAVFDGGELWLPDGGDAVGNTVRLRILARDVSVTLTSQQDTSILNRFEAEVLDLVPDVDDAMSLVRLQIGGSTAVARITRRSATHLQLGAGSRVWAQVKSVAVMR